MPTKFEKERDEARLARVQRVSQQIKETDRQMSRETSRTLLLYTGDIEPDPDQPRRLYDEDRGALEELAASIRQVGVLSPIQVRPDPEAPGRYRIIVGERRWRASRLAGVNRIEAVVRDGWDAFQVRAAQYEENEKRQDVSDMARARSLAAMREADGGRRRGWDEIAERVGLQRNQVMRLVGLLQLPPAVQEMIDRRLLPGTHGFELVRLRGRVDDEEIVRLARSSSAGATGAKAGRPVKELARLITDRLQAAFEAQAKPPEAPPASGHASVAGGEAAVPAPEGPALPGRPTETGDASGLESSLEASSHGGAVEEDVQGPEAPRAFVVELDRAWRAGGLRPSERRLLRELLAAHPLPEAD